jgi:hypothetical protein
MRPAIRARWAAVVLLTLLMAALPVDPALAISGARAPGTARAAEGAPVPTSNARPPLSSAAVRRPDGRIRLGAVGYPGKTKPQSGSFIGDNVYNTTGAHQTATEAWYGGSIAGAYDSFDISIQNDGTRADRFKVRATGPVTTGWTIRYFHGTTNITSAVVAGTYQTTSLAPGATYLVTAKFTQRAGGDITRLVTITSAADATRKDAVKVALKFAACGC